MSTAKRPTVDEDVDDLDDLLDDFNAPPPPAPPAPQPSTSAAPAPASAPAPAAAAPIDDDDFAKELAAGMESLMHELAGPAVSGVAGAGGAQDAQQKAFLDAWESMLVEGMNGAAGEDGEPGSQPPPGAATAGAPGAAGADGSAEGEDAFQRTIREAMERMKTSEATMQADAQTGSGGSDDPLAALLSSLGDGSGGEGEDDEELQGMLESMMTQLMSKEVLYDPLKELNDKFPEYLEKNAATLSDADKARYAAQRTSVREILDVFETPGFSDDDPDSTAKVVSLMNEMQKHGSPPPELMGPLPAGFNMGADGMPALPDGCVIA